MNEVIKTDLYNTLVYGPDSYKIQVFYIYLRKLNPVSQIVTRVTSQTVTRVTFPVFLFPIN